MSICSLDQRRKWASVELINNKVNGNDNDLKKRVKNQDCQCPANTDVNSLERLNGLNRHRKAENRFTNSLATSKMTNTSKDRSNLTTGDTCTANGSVAKLDIPEGEDGDNDNEKSDRNMQYEDDTEGLPIDRGWAWIVLVGCFVNLMLLVGYNRSLSILYVEYLRLFQASASATSLIMGVSSGVYSIGALFTMHFVLERLEVRKTVLLGATITIAGMLAGVFAPNIAFLISVHCVLTGFGHSMLYGPGLVIIGRYFKKRRGMAMAVVMSAYSISAGVFPMLTRLMLNEYGIRGTMLLFTGITMNMFVSGSLLRPIEFFKKQQKPIIKVDTCADVRVSSGNVNCVSANGVKESLTIKQNVFNGKSRPQMDNLEPKEDILSTSVPVFKDSYFSSLNHLNEPRARTYSDCRRPQFQHITESEKVLYASNPDMLAVSVLDLTKERSEKENPGSNQLAKHSTKPERCSCSILDMSLLRKPMFQLLIFCSSFGIMVNDVPNYLPALANEKGIAKNDAALLLLIMGSIDFFSRLVLGFLVDLRVLKVNQIIVIGLICSGTLCQFTSFYNTFPLMIMFAVANGVVGSSYHGLSPILVVDFMGMEYMAKTLGFTSMTHGMSIAVSHPIIGGIKDLSGYFTYGFTYIGVCAYIAALLLLVVEPVCRKRDKSLMEREEDPENECKKPLKT